MYRSNQNGEGNNENYFYPINHFTEDFYDDATNVVGTAFMLSTEKAEFNSPILNLRTLSLICN